MTQDEKGTPKKKIICILSIAIIGLKHRSVEIVFKIASRTNADNDACAVPRRHVQMEQKTDR